MRTVLFVRAVGLAIGIAFTGPHALAQPHKLLFWGPPGSSTHPWHGRNVIAASAGGGTGATSGAFTLIVNLNGDLEVNGNNGFGQYGYAPGYPAQTFTQFPCDLNPTYCKTLPVFTPPPNFTTYKFRQISAGWDHALGLSDDPALASTKGLVAWGGNDPQYNRPCDIPNLWHPGVGSPPVYPEDAPWGINPDAKVVKICAGEFINAVLFDNGQIATWGHHAWGVDPRCPVLPSDPYHTRFLPNRSWTFKDVITGGHYVMALILEAPGSTLPVHPATGREGEGYIISWGTWDHGSHLCRGPGFHGYIPNTNPPQPTVTSPVNHGSSIPVEYQPPYDVLFAGHVVSGGIIKNPTPAQTAQGIKPGTVHLWGDNFYNCIDGIAPNTTFEQLHAGYAQWVVGVAVEDYTGYTGVPPHHIPIPRYELQSWGSVGGGSPLAPPPGGFPLAPVVGLVKLLHGPNSYTRSAALCYDPNCDGSTATPVLTANDMICFTNLWTDATAIDPNTGLPVLTSEQQQRHYCNCDGSTVPPVLTSNDWVCFMNKFAVGPCP
jgi:hypothetical protein